MKRIHLIGMMAAGLAMLAAGCTPDGNIVTLGARIDNKGYSKVYIDNGTPSWDKNDQIRVNDQTLVIEPTSGSIGQLTKVTANAFYRAIYPADIVKNADLAEGNTVEVTLPGTQQYEQDSRGHQKIKMPMGAYTLTDTLLFRNLCSLVKVVVKSNMANDFVLDHITVKARNAYLSGKGRATVAGGDKDAIEMTPSSATHEVTLAFPSSNKPTIRRGGSDTYYIVVPETSSDMVTITLYAQNSHLATFERQQATFRHNNTTTLNLTVDSLTPPPVDRVLNGLFSVSASKQVRFSPGNLQYQATTNTWRFAEKQWFSLGDSNISTSQDNPGWIDLFGWGTSGWRSGAISHDPWSTSTLYSNYYPGGESANGLTGAYSEADWAWHNAIFNGGNAPHLWRTLSIDEWKYLLFTRPNGAAKHGTGNINGIGGLIILPDSWTLPTGCSFTAGYASSNVWSRNSYTLSQWEEMEAAGAVFLPAGGYRWGTLVSNAGTLGNYWSTTPLDTYYANCVVFCGSALDATKGNVRGRGFSVRPVRENN
ncbi:MAG: hypothetical protein IJM33_04010 [Bacteroidales bacterium]|nr:hypothetical protein [Bacteroidales bacterium]MBR3412585.1 hypothetical protein [Bacteroidales bacterium]